MQLLDGLQRRLVHPGRQLAERTAAVGQLQIRLRRAAAQQIGELGWQLRSAVHRSLARLPRVAEQGRRVRSALDRIVAGEAAALERLEVRIAALRANLGHLGPLGVLARGYSIARDEAGRIVRSSAALALGQELSITFAKGSVKTRVQSRD